MSGKVYCYCFTFPFRRKLGCLVKRIVIDGLLLSGDSKGVCLSVLLLFDFHFQEKVSVSGKAFDFFLQEKVWVSG